MPTAKIKLTEPQPPGHGAMPPPPEPKSPAERAAEAGERQGRPRP